MSNVETVAEGRFLALVKRGKWEYVTRTNASGVVIVVPLTNEGNLIFVEQFRPPVGKRVIEFPAGLAGDIAGQEDEKVSLAAERELAEETGYQAAKLQRVFTGPSSAGMSDEVSTIYLATELSRAGAGGGVDGEDITVHEVPLDQAHDWLEQQQRDGHYVAARVYAGLYFLQRSQR